MKLFLITSFTLLFVCFGALLGATEVKAASPYDDIIREPSNPLQLGNQQMTKFELGQYMQNRNWGTCQEMYNNFADNLTTNTGKYTISLLNYGSTNEIAIHFTLFADVTDVWQTNGGYLQDGNEFLIRLLFNGSSVSSQCRTAEPWDRFLIASSESYGVSAFLLETNHQIIYPEGYEGIIVTPTQPQLPPLTYKVNFTYSNSTNFLQATYTNKVTDPVSQLPDPNIIWWRLRVDGLTSSTGTIICDIELPKSQPFSSLTHCPTLNIDQTKEYYLTAQVNPTNNEHIDASGYDITYLINFYKIDFSKPSTGSTESCTPGAGTDMYTGCSAPIEVDFTECFTDTFPFVDVLGCTYQFQLLTDVLIYGGIKFPNWVHSPQCVYLNTMDDWLDLPQGYQVCPQIPQEVRNVVTPFIAFMLGIVTIGFISRHNDALSWRNR